MIMELSLVKTVSFAKCATCVLIVCALFIQCKASPEIAQQGKAHRGRISVAGASHIPEVSVEIDSSLSFIDFLCSQPTWLTFSIALAFLHLAFTLYRLNLPAKTFLLTFGLTVAGFFFGIFYAFYRATRKHADSFRLYVWNPINSPNPMSRRRVFQPYHKFSDLIEFSFPKRHIHICKSCGSHYEHAHPFEHYNHAQFDFQCPYPHCPNFFKNNPDRNPPLKLWQKHWTLKHPQNTTHAKLLMPPVRTLRFTVTHLREKPFSAMFPLRHIYKYHLAENDTSNLDENWRPNEPPFYFSPDPIKLPYRKRRQIQKRIERQNNLDRLRKIFKPLDIMSSYIDSAIAELKAKYSTTPRPRQPKIIITPPSHPHRFKTRDIQKRQKRKRQLSLERLDALISTFTVNDFGPQYLSPRLQKRLRIKRNFIRKTEIDSQPKERIFETLAAGPPEAEIAEIATIDMTKPSTKPKPKKDSPSWLAKTFSSTTGITPKHAEQTSEVLESLTKMLNENDKTSLLSGMKESIASITATNKHLNEATGKFSKLCEKVSGTLGTWDDFIKSASDFTRSNDFLQAAPLFYDMLNFLRISKESGTIYWSMLPSLGWRILVMFFDFPLTLMQKFIQIASPPVTEAAGPDDSSRAPWMLAALVGSTILHKMPSTKDIKEVVSVITMTTRLAPVLKTIPDLLGWIRDCLPETLKIWIQKVVPHGVYMKMFKPKETWVEDFIVPVWEIFRQSQRRKVMYEPQTRGRVAALYTYGVALLNRMVNDGFKASDCHIIRATMEKLCSLERLRIDTKPLNEYPYCRRVTPYCIWLTGDPGVGKTSCGPAIIKLLAPPNWPDSNLIYPINTGARYLNNYSNQFAVYWDDIGQRNVVDTDAPEMMQFMQMVGNFPYNIPSAHLEDKSMMFGSDLVLATTNSPYPKPPEIRHADALWRRRNVLAHVSCAPAFRKDFSTAVDPAKIDPNNPYGHLRFGLLNPTRDTAPTGVQHDFTNFINYLREDMMEHFRREAASVRNLKDDIEHARDRFNETFNQSTEMFADHWKDILRTRLELSAFNEPAHHDMTNSILDDIRMIPKPTIPKFETVSAGPPESEDPDDDEEPSIAQSPEEIGSSASHSGHAPLLPPNHLRWKEHYAYQTLGQYNQNIQWTINTPEAKEIEAKYSYLMSPNVAATCATFAHHWSRLSRDRLGELVELVFPENFEDALEDPTEYNDTKVNLRRALDKLFDEDRVGFTDLIAQQMYQMVMEEKSATANAVAKTYKHDNLFRAAKFVGTAVATAGLVYGLWTMWEVFSGSYQTFVSVFKEQNATPVLPDSKQIEAAAKFYPGGNVQHVAHVNTRHNPIQIVSAGLPEKQEEMETQINAKYDLISSRIMPNLVSIYWTNPDQILEPGQEPTKLNKLHGLFVDGNVFVTTSHFFTVPGGGLRPEGWPIHIEATGLPTMTENFSKLHMCWDPKRDYAFYKCSNRVTNRRRLTHHFFTESDVERYRDFPCIVPKYLRDLSPLWQSTHAKLVSNVSYNRPNKNDPDNYDTFVVPTCYYYQGFVELGTCGAPCISINPSHQRSVVGIHVASGLNRVPNYGYSTIITQEVIQRAISILEERTNSLVISGFEEMIEVGDAIAAGTYVPEGEIQIFGNPTDHTYTSRQPTRTQIQPSLLHGKIRHTQKKEPSVICNNDPRTREAPEGGHPIMAGVQKYGKISHFPCHDPTLTLYIAQNMGRDLFHHDVQFEPRVLTDYETINGSESYDQIHPLDFTTSPGLNYINHPEKPKGASGKKWLLRPINYVCDPPRYEIDPQSPLAPKLKHLEIKLQNKTMGDNVVWNDCLKDELRPIEKIRKPKTRVFNIPPLELTILCKKYFGAIVAHIKRHFNKLGSSIGMDPMSIDWTSMNRRLLENSEFGFDTDFKNWDGRMNTVVWFVFLQMCDIYYQREHAADPKTRNVRHGLLAHMAHRCSVVLNLLIQVFIGDGSGCWLTDIINSTGNTFEHAYAYFNLVPPEFQSWKSWKENVVFLSYGDDCMNSVKLRILQYYNAVTVAKELAKFGMEATPATKDAELVPFKYVTDLIYLKNRTRQVGVLYLPLMDLDTIIEMVAWVRAKSRDEHWTMLIDNCNTSLRFMSMYGPVMYNKWRTRLIYELTRVRPPAAEVNLLQYVDCVKLYDILQMIPDDNGLDEPLDIDPAEHELYNPDLFIRYAWEDLCKSKDLVLAATSESASGVKVADEQPMIGIAEMQPGGAPDRYRKGIMPDMKWNLQNMSSRLNLVTTLNYTSGQVGKQILTLQVPHDVLTSNTVSVGFERFQYVRFKSVTMKAQLNGTGLHAGAVGIYVVECQVPGSVIPKYANNPTNWTTLKHVILNASAVSSAEITIPWRCPNSFIRMTNSDPHVDFIGYIVMEPLVDLTMASGATTSLPIVIQAFFDGVEFFAPSPIPRASGVYNQNAHVVDFLDNQYKLLRPLPDNHRRLILAGEEMEPYAMDGPYIAPRRRKTNTLAAGNINTTISNFTSGGPMTGVSSTTNNKDELDAALSATVPEAAMLDGATQLQYPITNWQMPFPSLALTDKNALPVQYLTYKPNCDTYTTVETFDTTEHEMSIKDKFLDPWNYKAAYNWKVSDPVGTVICAGPMCPFETFTGYYNDKGTYVSNFAPTSTGLLTLTLLEKTMLFGPTHWSGAYSMKFQVYKSQFQQGRLVFMCFPNENTVPSTLTNQANEYMHYFELSPGQTEFIVTIPYYNTTPYVRCPEYTSTAPSAKQFNNHANGVWALVVIAPLVEALNVPTSISIVRWICGRAFDDQGMEVPGAGIKLHNFVNLNQSFLPESIWTSAPEPYMMINEQDYDDTDEMPDLDDALAASSDSGGGATIAEPIAQATEPTMIAGNVGPRSAAPTENIQLNYETVDDLRTLLRRPVLLNNFSVVGGSGEAGPLTATYRFWNAPPVCYSANATALSGPGLWPLIMSHYGYWFGRFIWILRNRNSSNVMGMETDITYYPIVTTDALTNQQNIDGTMMDSNANIELLTGKTSAPLQTYRTGHAPLAITYVNANYQIVEPPSQGHHKCQLARPVTSGTPYAVLVGNYTDYLYVTGQLVVNCTCNQATTISPNPAYVKNDLWMNVMVRAGDSFRFGGWIGNFRVFLVGWQTTATTVTGIWPDTWAGTGTKPQPNFFMQKPRPVAAGPRIDEVYPGNFNNIYIDNTGPISVTGTVGLSTVAPSVWTNLITQLNTNGLIPTKVENFPPQGPITGTVDVANFPQNQNVTVTNPSNNVTVTNFPAVQSVNVNNTPNVNAIQYGGAGVPWHISVDNIPTVNAQQSGRWDVVVDNVAVDVNVVGTADVNIAAVNGDFNNFARKIGEWGSNVPTTSLNIGLYGNIPGDAYHATFANCTNGNKAYGLVTSNTAGAVEINIEDWDAQAAGLEEDIDLIKRTTDGRPPHKFNMPNASLPALTREYEQVVTWNYSPSPNIRRDKPLIFLSAGVTDEGTAGLNIIQIYGNPNAISIASSFPEICEFLVNDPDNERKYQMTLRSIDLPLVAYTDPGCVSFAFPTTNRLYQIELLPSRMLLVPDAGVDPTALRNASYDIRWRPIGRSALPTAAPATLTERMVPSLVATAAESGVFTPQEAVDYSRAFSDFLERSSGKPLPRQKENKELLDELEELNREDDERRKAELDLQRNITETALERKKNQGTRLADQIYTDRVRRMNLVETVIPPIQQHEQDAIDHEPTHFQYDTIPKLEQVVKVKDEISVLEKTLQNLAVQRKELKKQPPKIEKMPTWEEQKQLLKQGAGIETDPDEFRVSIETVRPTYATTSKVTELVESDPEYFAKLEDSFTPQELQRWPKEVQEAAKAMGKFNFEIIVHSVMTTSSITQMCADMPPNHFFIRAGNKETKDSYGKTVYIFYGELVMGSKSHRPPVYCILAKVTTKYHPLKVTARMQMYEALRMKAREYLLSNNVCDQKGNLIPVAQ